MKSDNKTQTVKPNTLTLGYDLDSWHNYGIKIPVTSDLSPATNSHMLINGMSGGGKSYALMGYFSKLVLAQHNEAYLPNFSSEYYFSDYKADDSFSHLRGLPRYKSFKHTRENLDLVYSCLNARLSGEDKTRHPITLIWDEYMADMLALITEDKKNATATMSKISEILLMGRSMGIRLISSMQRPDAIAFPVGSRLNYGIVIVLGAVVRSIYEMLMPDHLDQIKGRQFERGEGVVLLQGSELHFIKIPEYGNFENVKQLCIQALS